MEVLEKVQITPDQRVEMLELMPPSGWLLMVDLYNQVPGFKPEAVDAAKALKDFLVDMVENPHFQGLSQQELKDMQAARQRKQLVAPFNGAEPSRNQNGKASGARTRKAAKTGGKKKASKKNGRRR